MGRVDFQSDFDFGGGQNPCVVFRRELRKANAGSSPAVVRQGAAVGWLPRHVASDPSFIGIVSRIQRDGGSLCFTAERHDLYIFGKTALAPLLNHARGGADFLVGKSAHVFLQKINEATFPLKDRKELERGGEIALRFDFWGSRVGRCLFGRCHRRGLAGTRQGRFGVRVNQASRQLSTEEDSKCKGETRTK